MNSLNWKQNNSREQILEIVDQLAEKFPELDLSFNLIEGSRALRCIASGFPDKPFEILVGRKNTSSIILEASIKIRKITDTLDA